MTDNVTADAGSGGATFATDEEDLGGGNSRHIPWMKLMEGANGTFNEVGSANPLPVEIIDVTNTLVADVGTIDTSLTDLPNVIGTDGSAGPSKAISIAGTLTTGELQEVTMKNPGDSFDAAIKGVVCSSMNMIYNGTNFDVMREGSEAGSLLVDLGGNNDVTLATLPDTAANDLAGISADTADIVTTFGAAKAWSSAFADDVSNTNTHIETAAYGMYFDGTTWDRMRGDATDGMLVNLGGNNDVVSTGAEADNAAVSSNPLLVAGRYDASPATRDDGDVATLQTDATGTLFTYPKGLTNTPADGLTTSGATIKTTAVNMLYNGTTLDFMREGSEDGSLRVDLSDNNDVVASGGQADNAAVTTNPLLVGGRYDDTPATRGDGDATSFQTTATGAMHVEQQGTVSVDWDGTAPPIGAGTEAAALRVTLATDSTGLVSVDDNGSNLSIDLGGTAATLNTGAVDAGTQRVTLATDVSLPTGGNTIGAVTIDDTSFANSDGNALGEGILIQGDDGTDRKNINVDASTGDVQVDVTSVPQGTSHYRNVDANAEAAIKASAGTLYWLHVMNMTAAVAYVHLYDAGTGDVTPGSTTPNFTFPIATQGDTNGAGFTINLGAGGHSFTTAITLVVTTTIDGSSGDPGTNGVFVNAGYA